jgi:hypothetical protein
MSKCRVMGIACSCLVDPNGRKPDTPEPELMRTYKGRLLCPDLCPDFRLTPIPQVL